jgi:hypothetical protein
MRHIRLAICATLFAILLASASMAQNGRTFVSGAGDDKSPCSLTSPCRTFGEAISLTNAGGEVVVLTSAGYGPFTISKAVTVEAAPGVYAGITVTTGDGIDINAGTMDTVTLRGLTVNNQGGNGSGIVFNTGGTLHIEGCVVNGFSAQGAGGLAILAPGNIFVKDTIARENANGVFVNRINTGTTSVSMDRVHSDANQVGLLVVPAVSGAIVNAAILNSSFSGNESHGIQVAAFVFGGVALLNIEGCLISNNNVGMDEEVASGGAGNVSISNCTITSNSAFGYTISPLAVIYSRGQNTIMGNGLNSGSLTSLAGQ